MKGWGPGSTSLTLFHGCMSNNTAREHLFDTLPWIFDAVFDFWLFGSNNTAGDIWITCENCHCMCRNWVCFKSVLNCWSVLLLLFFVCVCVFSWHVISLRMKMGATVIAWSKMLGMLALAATWHILCLCHSMFLICCIYLNLKLLYLYLSCSCSSEICLLLSLAQILFLVFFFCD